MIPPLLNLRIIFFILLLAYSFLFLTDAAAQTQPTGSDTAIEIPSDITEAQVDDLVARLSDEQVRQLLIRHLDKVAVAAAEEAKPSVADVFSTGLARLRQNVNAMAAKSSDLINVPSMVWKQVTADGAVSGSQVLFRFFLFFFVGVVAERLFKLWTGRAGLKDAPAKPLVFRSKLGIAVVRATMEFLSIIIFALATVCSWLVFHLDSEGAKLLFTVVLGGVVVWRMIAVVSRVLVAPKLPWLRLIPLGDDAARSIHGAILLFTVLILFIRIPVDLLAGYDPSLQRLVGWFTSAIFVAVVIFSIFKYGAAIPALIGKGESSSEADDRFGQYMADNWHIIAIIFVFGVWLLAIVINLATGAEVLPAFIASLVIVVFIPLADAGIRAAVAKYLGPKPEDDHEPVSPAADNTSDEVAEHATPHAPVGGTYENVVVTNLRIVLGVLVLMTFFKIWNINILGLAQELVGERFANGLFDISITGLLAYALWSVVSTAVQTISGPEPVDNGLPSGEIGGAGSSRIGTLLPLFRKFLFITLLVMFGLIVLSSLGVNIGPLIAGAGVLGIAIGFGAQTLVKDIVSGVFFLLDDAFRVGEYVEIGSTRGSVEKISVRSLRLRHHNGPLHTVPFGEIQTLTNWSRDWAIMKFELRIPFETDIDVVRKIIKRTGQEMMEDERFKPFMLAPLKSQGVNRMDDSALIIRCKFTSVPGEQFVLRREAFTRIQHAFEEKGIKFAPRRVIVETSSPEVTPEAAAAAAGSTAVAEENSVKAKDEP